MDLSLLRTIKTCMAVSLLLSQLPVGAQIDRPFFQEVRGEWLGDHAVIQWVTSDETGSAAFRAWRVTPAGDELVGDQWQEADVFLRQQNTYQVTDPIAKEGDSVLVLIEELTLGGDTRKWGPWKVTFDVSAPEPRALLAAETQWIPEPLSPLPPGPAVKVPVTRHDLYAVSFESIAAGLDLSLAEVAARASNAMLRVHHEGEPVAYVVESDLEYIWFYGWPITNRYTRTQYFWIEPGAGLPMQVQSPDAILVSSNLTHLSTVRFKEDVFIQPDHFSAVPNDFYFWKRFSATNPNFKQKTMPVDMAGYAGGDVDLTLHIEGFGFNAISPNHEAQISFNGESLGSVFFDGRDTVNPTFTISEPVILAQGNELTIEANLLPQRTNSFFALKHFDLSYDRYYAPSLLSQPSVDGDHERLSADRFSDALVLDITNPYQPVRVAAADGTLPLGTSWPVSQGSQWFFRERDAIQFVDAEPAGHGEWMRSSTNVVDYLVITSRDLEVPAVALADYRAGQGLRTRVALYNEICDQFAYGLNTPEAIRSFLMYAHTYWQEAPGMVLLAGWGHFDYLGAQFAVPNHLPPLLAFDLLRLRPADLLFADLTGNEVPDFSIGRLPVQNVGQFNDYINKLQAYEVAGPQVPHQTAAFFADNADGGGNFEVSNQVMSNIAEAQYTTTEKVLNPALAVLMRIDMMNALESGEGIFHYTGHGSFQQLADENVLNNNDVLSMSSHPPTPLFASLTCYIGRFDHPTVRSLSEILVLKPQGGALAVYAPSGLSLNAYAEEFGSEFYQNHAADGFDTLGLALLATAQELGPPTQPLEAESRRTYNLLGDPALKLRGGEGGHVPATLDQFTLWRWERFSALELMDPEISAASAIPPGQEWNNLQDYAFGGEVPALNLLHNDDDAGHFEIEWFQRAFASDLEYGLKWTDDLQEEWSPVGVETIITVAPGPNPGVSRLRATVPADVPKRFFRVKVAPQ